MPVQIPIPKLRNHCDPLDCPPWGCGAVPRAAISEAIKEGRLNTTPFSEGLPGGYDSDINHAERIAYFVVHGWEAPIEVDVGVPALLCHVDWLVQDGNHRLAAAIYRGDSTILAFVDGCVNYAFELFGIDVTEKDEDAS